MFPNCRLRTGEVNRFSWPARGARALLLAGFLVLAGCRSPHKSPATRETSIPYQINAVVKPGDPVPHPIYLVQLDVYQMDVPYGAVSQSAAFWSRIDHQNISPQTPALLDRNGFRVGQGEIADWEFFRQILEKNPVHTHASSRVAYQEQREPLLTRSDQPAQNLFYFDTTGQLVGRSFGEADNLMLLSFWPTPRHNGQLHIQIVPAVRSRDEQYQPEWTDGHEAIARIRPEFFYDLALEADIDVNHFLIICPSAAAKMASSLGGAFLVDGSSGARTETVLIFVARPIGAPTLMHTN